MEITSAISRNYADAVNLSQTWASTDMNNLNNVHKMSLYKPLQSKSIFEALLSHIRLNSFEKLLRESQNHRVDLAAPEIDV